MSAVVGRAMGRWVGDQEAWSQILNAARAKLHEGQLQFDLALGAGTGGPAGTGADSVITAKRSRWLCEVVEHAWQRLGFDTVADDAFFQLVLARLVAPTSMSDACRVVGEIGVRPAHRNTYANALKRCAAQGYRDEIAYRCSSRAETLSGT